MLVSIILCGGLGVALDENVLRDGVKGRRVVNAAFGILDRYRLQLVACSEYRPADYGNGLGQNDLRHCGFAECAQPKDCHTFRKRHIAKVLAAVEGILCDGYQTLGERDFLKCFVSFKCIAADCGHALGNSIGCSLLAERIIKQLCTVLAQQYAVHILIGIVVFRNINALKCGAAVKCGNIHFLYQLFKHHCFQCSTAHECTSCDMRQITAAIELRKACAIFECTFSDIYQ